MDYESALEKAKLGTLNASTADLVAKQLNYDDTHDKYTLLHIIGHAHLVKYEPLISRFLVFEEDPMIAALALRILCIYWGLTDKYLDVLKASVQGMNWDDETHSVQSAAIRIAGEYLITNDDVQLLQILLDQFLNAQSEEIRHETYDALCRSTGITYYLLFHEIEQYINTGHPNTKIIAAVKERLNEGI
jgi:hypothetical protein